MSKSVKINVFSVCLEKGKTILYPTDTIWGLGCDATNQDAVDRIYALKIRSKSKPLITLVSDIYMLAQYVGTVPKNIDSLLATDHPITIIYLSLIHI